MMSHKQIDARARSKKYTDAKRKTFQNIETIFASLHLHLAFSF